ncbi:hypothetical protein C1645_826637 [Glomus cerebriforme]|uniref:Uncharacterized protein n=1 Tax=Glomus cerebriforme TaxID=658196 RepID=A0A397SUJ7_9GLOM|nr:hypothetical protein C1645_826637 [Glomus cerebriforme]
MSKFHNNLKNIIIYKDDEIFIKKFLKDFYSKIIETNNFNNFENILIEWIENFLLKNNKNPQIILKIMQNHKENLLLFSSLIGFFYQHGIGCNVNRDDALNLFFLTFNNNNNYNNDDDYYYDDGNNIININNINETQKEINFLNKNFKNLHLIKENDNNNLLKMMNIIIGKYLLSLFYYNDIITNNEIRIVSENQRKEFEKKLKSALEGNVIAQCYLGYCYRNGKGIIKDEKKAFEWYLKSANKGYSLGQYALGHCYANGIGIEKDETKAFEWYLKSAEGGNTNAQYNLGNCYIFGRGIKKDEKKGFEWFLKSANNKNSKCYYNLGMCYDKGIGTEKNFDEAIIWYKKASENGLEKAKIKLLEIL